MTNYLFVIRLRLRLRPAQVLSLSITEYGVPGFLFAASIDLN
jgi:hypothetical protein